MVDRIANHWYNQGGVKVQALLHAQATATPFDVIVPIIQSNMRGVADDYVSTDQFNDSRVKQWDWTGSAIAPAVEPLSTRETTTGMGASNTFIKDYLASSLPAGRNILVVNTARGGTGFTTPSTNTSGGSLLTWDRTAANDANNLALTTIAALQTIMAGLPSGSRIVAYLANHGSTDGSNNEPKATFKAQLQDWITYLRTQMSTPNVPYVMMQMRPDLIANENRHKIIDDAQTETAAEMAHVGKGVSPVGSTYYRSDSVHFNALGMRAIGHDLYSKWSPLL